MTSKKLPEAELFDADGTLWDVRPIRHYVTPPKRDFHAFHMASIFCLPNLEVVDAVHEAVRKGRTPILVTARMAKYRQVTKQWLEQHKVPIDLIHMRTNEDTRPDYVIKQEILDKILLQFNVVHAHDDNPAVVEVWKRNGIETTEVPGWDDQFTGLALPKEPSAPTVLREGP